MPQPQFIVIAGPNGAGKSTIAPLFIQPGMVFLNADEVAKSLPNYPSKSSDFEAGRIVLEQMDSLSANRESFSIETTLASRTLAPRIIELKNDGYEFKLIFVWSIREQFSVDRVSQRVKAGGHSIPEETIRRRFHAGVRNFHTLYRPLADHWIVLDNTSSVGPRSIATGERGGVEFVEDPELWSRFNQRDRTDAGD